MEKNLTVNRKQENLRAKNVIFQQMELCDLNCVMFLSGYEKEDGFPLNLMNQESFSFFEGEEKLF